MKKILSISCLVALLFSFTVHAASFSGMGTVHTLATHADDLWGDATDFLLVTGFKSAGNCRTYTDGLVLIRLPSTAREFAVALAAQMAGKEVVVSVADDRVDADGWCILRWISIKN